MTNKRDKHFYSKIMKKILRKKHNYFDLTNLVAKITVFPILQNVGII